MPTHSHGNLRGSDSPLRSRNFEGRFGRMFRNLPAAQFKKEDLEKLSHEMISRAEPIPDGKPDPAESGTPAGYTYLGQFIAHDLTFDPASSLQRDNDPDALEDYRTPRFDLDSVYGRGPADQPYLYQDDDVHLVIGDLLDNKKDWDVPRVESTERAIVGDPRNDENVIISQLHAIFLRLHNRIADVLGEGHDLAEVQRSVRWHYQWAILYDFLPATVSEETYNEVLPHVGLKSDILSHPPQLRFYKVHESPYLPIEFSAAAYRFGHSTVRRSYRLNQHRLAGGRFNIFGEDSMQDLRGFRRFNRSWAVDWSLFLKGVSPDQNDELVQRAHSIGPSLAEPLGNLPPEVARHLPSLALRNLLRGLHLNLPSGQAVCYAMGKTPVPDKELAVGTPGRTPTVYLTDISKQFSDNAPLWYYILAEAQNLCRGEKLGPVGGRIVMETFVGLMMADGHSFLRQNPLWKPNVKTPEKFGMADLIRMATSQ